MCIAEHFKAEAGDDVAAKCIGTAFVLTETSMIYIFNVEFRVTGSGKGFQSAKGKMIPIPSKYCPFCGKSSVPIEVDITEVPV